MRKSVLTLSVVLVLVALILAACGGSTTTSGPKTIKTIGMTVQAISNPFFVAMLHGAQAEAKKIGASVLLEDANHDLGVQTNEMDDFIQKHVDLILLNAVDSAGIAPAVQRAVQAGIPVIAVDVGAQGGVSATVASDNVAAGRLACQYMADRLKGQGKIAILDGPPVTAVTDRIKGCMAVLAATPGLQVMARQVGNGDRTTGLELGTSILTANPHLDAIFAINDPEGLGVELAAKQANRKDYSLLLLMVRQMPLPLLRPMVSLQPPLRSRHTL